MTIKPEELSSEALSLLNTYAQSQPHLFQMCLRDWIRSVESRLAAPAPPQEAAPVFKPCDCDCGARISFDRFGNAIELHSCETHRLARAERSRREEAAPVEGATCPEMPLHSIRVAEMNLVEMARRAELSGDSESAYNLGAHARKIREWINGPAPAPAKVETWEDVANDPRRGVEWIVGCAVTELRRLSALSKDGIRNTSEGWPEDVAERLEGWFASLPAAPTEPKLEKVRRLIQGVRNIAEGMPGGFGDALNVKADEAQEELDALEAK